MRRFLLIVCFLPILSGPAPAQDREEEEGLAQNGALRVYISTNDDDISIDFIREEIPVIDHVRDPGDAQVYIIITSQPTGALGMEYTFFLIGQHEFSAMADTLTYTSDSDHTLEKTREGQVHTLKMGLMRYIVRTPMSINTRIDFTEAENEVHTEDKWNSWIIRLFLGGQLRGERTYKYSNIWGGFNTARVTEDWKIEFSADMAHTVDKYKLDEGDLISANQFYATDALVVKSLGTNWSVGAKAHVGSYTFSNYRLKYYLFPGIEYNIFPYAESTRKQIRFMYSTGPVFHHYFDTTIYNKMNEQLWGHRLDIAAEVVQKWGSLDAYLGWKNYFHDWSKNNLSFRSSANIRIAKGLQIRFSGGVSMIHNQLSLVKGGASTEEILVRQRELATQYSVYTNLTIFYTFGSIYSSVVNPRFDDLNRW